MRALLSSSLINGFILGALILVASSASGQNQPQPIQHVTIPNPTPRPADLQEEFGDNPAAQKKKAAASMQAQLRAREVWLESNQILLLAQELHQEVVLKKKATSMAAEAAKVAKIEKLARTVQDNMKMH